MAFITDQYEHGPLVRRYWQGFEQNKFHIDRPGIEVGLYGDRPATILLSQGTTFEVIKFYMLFT